MKYRINYHKRGHTMKAEPLSAKEAAQKVGTDARTLRKFLRATREGVGQGNRWSVEGSVKQLEKLQKEFDAWEKNKGKSSRQTEPKLKVIEADDEDLDELDDELDIDEDEHLDDNEENEEVEPELEDLDA
jgi:hypothetical protein